MAFEVGRRIKFKEEKRPYTVQAVSASGRYLVCTKPFHARRTVMYTVVDLVRGIRGVDDSIGNSLGYETREECEEAADLFERGEFTFSQRRRPIAAILQACEQPQSVAAVDPVGELAERDPSTRDAKS